VITPNIDEAEVLLDIQDIKIIEDNQLELAKHLQQKYNCAVLLKGGHLPSSPTDILIERNAPPFIKRHDRIENICTHGTGCSLSAAITAFLAKGLSLQDAVEEGLFFLQGTLKNPHLLHVSGEPLYVLGLENPKK
jgi:hydroxymethylpyrimidine/phosphomethylpyrimidine kinase